MKASDVISTQLITVPPETLPGEFARLLTGSLISNVPVVHHRGNSQGLGVFSAEPGRVRGIVTKFHPIRRMGKN